MATARLPRRNTSRAASQTPAFERLECRQLFSVGSDAIAAEFRVTARETDASGLNVQSILGLATSAVTDFAAVPGALCQTYHNSGAIIWSAASGAHVVYGATGAEYASLVNAAANPLGTRTKLTIGLPTADESAYTVVAGSRVTRFSNGVIFSSPRAGVHCLYGSSFAEYNALAGETDASGLPAQQVIGLPVADELNLPNSAGGRVAAFSNGSIYSSTATGAHAVYGADYALYRQMDPTSTWLGLPIGDDAGAATARTQSFQCGHIDWTATTGARAFQTSVTLNFKYGTDWTITAAGIRDTVSIDQAGNALIITANGQTYTGPAQQNIEVYTRGGVDSIATTANVKARVTVASIDNAQTTISSAGARDIVWCDSTDVVTGKASVHGVSAFAGGVGKGLGDSLPNPSDSGGTITPDASLFGSAPVAADINQGSVGDCYFVSGLAALASQKPEVLLNTAVDLGDGTYAVEFFAKGAPTFIRVSNALPSGWWGGYMFAHPGANNTIWAPILEKAFAWFRSGANTYASINSGYLTETFDAVNLSSSYINANVGDSTLFNTFSAALLAGKAINLGTPGSYNADGMAHLVSGHAYTLIGISVTAGSRYYLVRNPWARPVQRWKAMAATRASPTTSLSPISRPFA